MTTEEYLRKVQEYFGARYNETQRQTVGRWATHRSPELLDKVFDSLVAKQDWRGGKLPLVGVMHGRLEELGVGTRARPVPDDKPQRCKACTNEYLEDQGEVLLCRSCLSMWLWMAAGRWAFAPSQAVLLGKVKRPPAR